MKRAVIMFMLPVLSSCKQSNELDSNTRTVTLTYIAWACACANWIEPDTARKYEHSPGDKMADHCIFIEPANQSLKLNDTLGYNGDLVEFTGQFYKEKGYPKGYIKTEEPLDKARVFRYTSYKIIRSHYREFMNELKK